MSEGVRVETLDGGALWHVSLATPKANILDMQKIGELCSVFERAREDAVLRAIVLDADGPHFSFGASVEEHLPGSYETMIPAFGALFVKMLRAEVVTLASVRGQCLGGGLELAAFCHRVFAAPDAKLGQPEIVLGVFAPVASAFLAERIGRSRAEDLCLSGRSVDAAEALRIGLVDELADDPTEAARAYAREYLVPRSAASLRLAVRALRGGFVERFRSEMDRIERLYLEELMTTHDAVEGLTAFVERRKPEWSHA